MFYSEPESELDSNFAINSVSDFDSESVSNSEFMNLVDFGFFTRYLHYSRKTCGFSFFSIFITESIVTQAIHL